MKLSLSDARKLSDLIADAFLARGWTVVEDTAYRHEVDVAVLKKGIEATLIEEEVEGCG